ncbi:STAS domain-containing protein [Hamadaea sp. NPDC050747]|uniref:STAS domain-containing protein n=1 Tax=Hamadaea sp. NPDC050747 TaxID=3155789 RepID=UPI0033D229C0
MAAPHETASRIPVVELVITEELDLWGLSRLTRLLDDALAVSPLEIVLDLEQCPFMDAAAIGVLLDAHRRSRLDGGLLTLRSPSPRLRRNLRLARADRVLHVTPAEPAAPANGSAATTVSAEQGGADESA